MPNTPLLKNENSLFTLTSNNSLLEDVSTNITVVGAVDMMNKLSCTTQLPMSSSPFINIQPYDLTQPCSAVECDKTWNPVCDSQNKTHKNLCLFKFYACKINRINGKILELAHEGECETWNKHSLHCPICNVDDPQVFVCDNLNKTHSSLCAISRFNCIQKTLRLPERSGHFAPMLKYLRACDFSEASESVSFVPLTKFTESNKMLNGKLDISIGTSEISKKNEQFECPEPTCSEEGLPVCDTKGKLHNSVCHFNHARCLAAQKGVTLSIETDQKCLSSLCDQNASDTLFVCDQQNITRTICEYQMLSCIMEKSYGLKLTIQHMGKHTGINVLLTSKIVAIKKWSFQRYTFLTKENVIRRRLANYSDLLNVECLSKCDKEYFPVCGTDDITYTNLCSLNQIRCQSGVDIHVAYTGECCDMDCPNNFNPICDDQGITHQVCEPVTVTNILLVNTQNLCFFGKERCITERITGRNISIEKFDVCNDTESCDIECPKTYQPICGSDGDTIVNECEMNKLNCFVEKNITTGNIITKEYDGECCPDHKCDYIFSPICDSEDVTHANECVFRQKSCVEYRKSGKNITVQYKGQCCSQPCEDEYKPVCDGTTTHDNMCKFKISQCEAEKRDQVLTLAYTGECCSLPTGKCEMTRECCAIEPCQKGVEPVCDSRGHTHASLCHFQNTKCIHDKIHPHNALIFAYKGPCCHNNCSKQWEPVCDQHGNVYKNQCSFTLKSCELHKMSNTLLLQTPYLCHQNVFTELSEELDRVQDRPTNERSSSVESPRVREFVKKRTL
uniref:Kazal-like domain-containing protein n=1 Tax=Heterorhabditis bacteriophora TaxID=37862 RepID=A0A1I7XBY1_HETBA